MEEKSTFTNFSNFSCHSMIKLKKKHRKWYLQFHVSHAAADGVNRAAVIQARVGLSQVEDLQMSFPLFGFDFITIWVRKSHQLLQKIQ